MVVRGRPIARARSVVPMPVRPSPTQRVPECVCVKLNASLTLARVMFHRYEVQGMYCWTGYIGAVRGAVTAVVSQGSRIFPALVSRYRKLPKGTDFNGILQRRQDQYIHERMLI